MTHTNPVLRARALHRLNVRIMTHQGKQIFPARMDSPSRPPYKQKLSSIYHMESVSLFDAVLPLIVLLILSLF